jgi:hypothetical protein
LDKIKISPIKNPYISARVKNCKLYWFLNS